MNRYKVSFRVNWPDDVRTANVIAENPNDARQRACRKLWGIRAHWWRDSIGPDFGQVMASNPARLGGANAITYPIRCDVERA